MFYVNKNGFDVFNDLTSVVNGMFLGNMKADVLECDDHYELMIDVPGVDKKDISISFEDSTLTIAVNVKEKNNDDNKKYLFKERNTASMERSFLLEEGDESLINAKLADGVLLVSVGKKQRVDKKKIVTIE